MENVVELTQKYHLITETYKKHDDAPAPTEETSPPLIGNEQIWGTILGLSADAALLRELFKHQTPEERDTYFHFAIECFECFIQANFTGPPLKPDIENLIQEKQSSNKEVDFAARLAMNNEDINVNTKLPVLLVVSEIIFDGCVVSDIVNLWWCCRALIIHQDILDELSPTLLSNADRLHRLIQGLTLDNGYIKAELYIELAQMYLKFHHISKTSTYISAASEILSLEYHLVGKLGKRTRYQEHDLAQLTLNVTIKDQNPGAPLVDDNLNIPENFALNDDVRLDNVHLNEENTNTNLPNTEQKLILTVAQDTLMASPSDELQVEEVLPFLELLLHQQNNTYCVRVMTLLLRGKLECKHKRTIERCLKQSEDIIACFTKESPPAINRIGDVFGTSLPPIWKVETQYADMLLNFSLVKNSLDIYLRLKLWEEVIVCYTLLKLRHKAVEIIEEQLRLKPTVKLMCLLGDATDDITCYEKAWIMSKKRSHRAQRHWGQFLFARKKYAECIPHFEKSLSINPLQSNIWLGLGFAALHVENWQTAATAYRRYTSLEPDGFEAWNNLAQAYIKLGNKRSAHHALLEALKCSFDNWKVWENLLIVSCDISNFNDLIRSYHRLLDLKEKYLNVEVLNVLVYSVCNDSNDSEGQSSRKYLQKTRELVGRITALYPGNGVVWELYACLAPALMLRAQRLQRAYRGYTQGTWDKNPKTCFQVLNVCSKLANIVLQPEIDPTNAIVSSIKLNLSSAVAAVRKHNWEETKVLLGEVSGLLQQVLDKIIKGHAALKVVG